MVYIGESEPWTQGVIRLERLDDDDDKVADGPDVVVVRGATTNSRSTTDWDLLAIRGLLFNGARIKIPGGNDGSWYTVIVPTDLGPNKQILQLTTPYRDPGTSKVDKVIAFEGGGPSTYLLELPAVVLPGADGEPRLLPRGIVIDLLHSDLPDAWWSDRGRFPARMDVMFSPRGTVMGSAASSGVIHFLLNEVGDTLRAFGVDGAAGQAGVDDDGDGNTDVYPPLVTGGPNDPDLNEHWYASDDLMPYDRDTNGNGVIDDDERNEGDKLILTLFCRTGQISTHPLFITEDVNGNGVLDPGEDVNSDNILNPRGSDLFFYAETGEVAGQ